MFCCCNYVKKKYRVIERLWSYCNMKSSIFWDITPCSPFKVSRRFGGTCRLHLQRRRISQARNFQRTTRFITTAVRTSNLTHCNINKLLCTELCKTGLLFSRPYIPPRRTSGRTSRLINNAVGNWGRSEPKLPCYVRDKDSLAEAASTCPLIHPL
jgi:hypothetical protein